MHSPVDETVGIDNATKIFVAARHPKSFISLDHADHLISRKEDAAYIAEVIASWAGRYVAPAAAEPAPADGPRDVVVRETRSSKLQQAIALGPHHLTADEPLSVGGQDTGPLC